VSRAAAGGIDRNPAFLLSQLGRLVRQELVEALAPWGLRPAQYGLLVALGERSHSSQRLIAEALAMDRSDGGARNHALERRGLVERGAAPADRRRHAVQLTASGRAMRDDLGRVGEQVNARFFAGLDEAERERLCALLEALWRGRAGSRRAGRPRARPVDSRADDR
jgi:DNA-binding MarR family transcriptional regulator